MSVRNTALLACLLSLPAAPLTGPAQAPPTELTAVLDRATSYVADYVKSLASVVAEERFDQRLDTSGDTLVSRQAMTRTVTTVTRTLLSDYLLVQVPGVEEWLPFRDVYSVDGTPVRDRSDRLLKLFVEPDANSYAQALRIRDESSRHNLGSGTRDTNVPTFGLQILNEKTRAGFAFKLRGRDRVSEIDSIVIEFEETSKSTLIVGRNNESVPLRGRFWIDPATGRVLRMRLETRPYGGRTTIDVVFREEPKLGLWVPGRMDERREAGPEMLEGRATYSNYRRFQVSTAVEIK